MIDVGDAYERHGAALFRYLLLQSGERQLAEDLLQDTFVRLAERPPSDERHLRAWLFRVALNRLRDVARTTRRRTELLGEAGSHVMSDGPGAPDRRVERAGARAELDRVLQGLPARDRTLLLMREAGLTQREMARVLGTTTGSVGTLLARALLRLARVMERTTATGG